MMKRFLYSIFYPLAKLYYRVFQPVTAGARALILRDDQILLVKNINKPAWTFPGGTVERNEAPESCVVREVKEELGINLTHIDFKLGEYFSRYEGKKDTIHIFVTHVDEVVITKEWEIDDAQWFTLTNLPGDTSPATRKRVQEFLDGKKNISGNW